MKIIYLSNWQEKKLPSKEIESALEKLGHSVENIDDQTFDIKEVMEKANKADMLLFHEGGVPATNQMDMNLGLLGLKRLLANITCRKVFWFPHKVWALNELWMESIIPDVDYGFLNDGTWVRRHKYENIHHLPFGCAERPEGEYREDLASDVAFAGTIYGTRKDLVNGLKQQFGNKFKVHNELWGKDFDDLCKSTKVLVVPKLPTNDFYWTDAPYRILASGGFVLHFPLEGMKEEGWQMANQYVTYRTFGELIESIKYFTDPKNEKERQDTIARGKEFVLDNFTYEKRLASMLETVKLETIKKQK